MVYDASLFVVRSVRKRDGRIVPFDKNRIVNAVFRAMQASGEGDAARDPFLVADRVMNRLKERYPRGGVPSIEAIQDIVEESLILLDFAKTAKAYILYRNERAQIREKKKSIPEHIQKLAEESKQYFRNPLSEFIYYRTYSRWIEAEGRRETWIETVDRYIDFMKENLGDHLTHDEYNELRESILRQDVMPSMRLLWSAGKAARKTHVAAYNCSFIAPSKIDDFAEIMYLLMCGTGVGYSVESQTIQQLPIIKRLTGEKLQTHSIGDSKEGWADAFTLGLKTWYAGSDIDFDYSGLRPAGARLATMGGRSSGPEPLRALLDFSRAKILNRQGRRLSNLDIHDIICKTGEVVVMGGVRRSALISLSDLDDKEMRYAKTGQFYLTEPQRSMANNSAVYTERPKTTQFMQEWVALAESGTGERGIFNRGSLKKQLPSRRWKVFKDHHLTCGTNPCVTGDTLVYVADGRGHVSIRKLAEEGKDVPVFSYNKSGRVVVRYMRNPRLTGEKQPVYAVLLDDGSSVKTTANHKFRLKNAEYKSVDELKCGDSLSIITKFESPIAPHKGRVQDYLWINNGSFGSNLAEHRIIASFYYNTSIPPGYVVHHRDHDTQNNIPENLEIMSREDHNELHSKLMIGDKNPMRRAFKEWDESKWSEYKAQHSKNNSGQGNKNFSGVTNEELRQHALRLTHFLGRRFSHKDWEKYAKENALPQYFSKWRRNHLGGILGLAKWAAVGLGHHHIDTDPRVVDSYKKYTHEGYNCEIRDGKVIILKNCEVCGRSFGSNLSHREYGVCSISCGLSRKWQDVEFKTDTMKKINAAHEARKEKRRGLQAEVYSKLKFTLGREPRKAEWVSACREKNASSEIARVSSPFRTYENLREFAGMYNHKVVSVEFSGYEDVYNGTVDEFHNFFVGGFESRTKNGKRKFVYLNNLNCGEIVLRSKQFCNLSEVVARQDDTEDSLLRKVRLAAILGTYQSTLTNFSYIAKEWKENCEEERLLGVSITGQWDSFAARSRDILKKMKQASVETNMRYAKRFGINASTCVTCVKPSGTVSQLVDAASGMHTRHAPYYIRRVRISATDPLFHMLKDQKFPYHPEVGQHASSATTFVLEFPVKAPEQSITNLSALDQLKHWEIVKRNFTEHNPSVTISVGHDEWIEVANWLYKRWDLLGGLSFLPKTEHAYQLAPYETISKEKYEELAATIPAIDFSQIVAYEKEDNTIGAKELACVGGTCEIDIDPDEGRIQHEKIVTTEMDAG